MRYRDFVELLERLGELTPQQKAVVIRHLGDRQDSMGRCTAGALPAPMRCPPHCQARQERVGSWGQSHGLKRYRCKDCGRTFNALTGTPLAHLRKREQWGRYAQALIEGVSVREAAHRCRIDKNTAFLWRHHLLHQAAGHRAEHEAGIVEADETFFLESFKGQRHLPRSARHRSGVADKRGINAEQIPVLVVRDRSRQTADFKLSVLDAAHVTEKLRPPDRPRRDPLYRQRRRLCRLRSNGRHRASHDQRPARPASRRGRFPHPERQCLRQPPQGLDAPLPRRSHQVSGELSGLAPPDRAIRRLDLPRRMLGRGGRAASQHLSPTEPLFLFCSFRSAQ